MNSLGLDGEAIARQFAGLPFTLPTEAVE
jgi:hypothetical protein